MFKPENRKYIIGGGIALAALVGLYAYSSRSKSQVSAVVAEAGAAPVTDAELVEKMKAIGGVKYDGANLDFEYLLKFMEVVAKHAKLLQQRNKVVLVKKRRAALQKNDDEAYSKIITEMLDEEEVILNEALGNACKIAGITNEEVEEQIQTQSQDQAKGYKFMVLQQQISMQKIEDPLAVKKDKKEFSRTELIEAFKMSQEMQMAQMEEMMKNPDDLRSAQTGEGEEQQKKMMHRLLLQQCKSMDTMHNKTGIELEELDEEIKKQKLEEDPEFRQIMQEYVQKMQQRAIQAQMMAGGGGMGGGMGGMM